jgi:hypothetical protein
LGWALPTLVQRDVTPIRISPREEIEEHQWL